MKITFLGTSAGAPTRYRNNSAIAFQSRQSKHWMLFDCGEGTQHQVLRTSLSLHKLNQVFISHLHGDHLYGLPGLLASCALTGRRQAIDVFGPKGIQAFLKTTFNVSQLHFEFDLKVTELMEKEYTFLFDDYTVRVFPVSHNVTSFAFIIQETKKYGPFNFQKAKALGIPEGPLYGKLARQESITLPDGRVFNGVDFIGSPHKKRKIIICGDNDNPDLLLPSLEDCELLVHEATYTQKTYNNLDRKFRHSTALAVGIVSEIAQIPNLILTHISPRYKNKTQTGRNAITEIEDEIKSVYTGKWFVAEDYQQYMIDHDGDVYLFYG
jgi:ribonuclease Z